MPAASSSSAAEVQRVAGADGSFADVPLPRGTVVRADALDVRVLQDDDADDAADAAWTARMRGHVLDADHAWVVASAGGLLARAPQSSPPRRAGQPVQIRVCHHR